MQLEDIKGFGKKTITALNELNINSVKDLLLCFPKKYDINEINEVKDWQINQNLTFKSQIVSEPKIYFIRKRLTKLSFQAKTDNLLFTVSIFNREFMKRFLNPGTKIIVSGKFLKNFNSFSASNIVLEENFEAGIIPVYNLKSIPEKRIRNGLIQLIHSNLDIEDNLPNYLLKKRSFPEISESLKMIHFPKDNNEISLVKQRMAYEELLKFGLRVELIKRLNTRIITPKKNYDINKVKELIKRIPFELTDDQKQATNEIFLDLHKPNAMNRLLQGDVGSGKTIVAIISSYAVVTSGYQVAILAPTLVLAKQHFDTFSEYLKNFNVEIALLTSDSSLADRRKIIADLQSGKTKIIVGTHSLIQEEINFANLGFIVIDEQQRFGVEQRRKIREKGLNPDLLIMTATPIPRTMAISMFENTELSIIKEKPKNRKTIKTKIIDFENLNEAFNLVEKELKSNRQIYVVCPLIEDNQDNKNVSVEEAFKLLSKRFKNTTIAMLHGKMTEQEKSSIFNDFTTHKIQILISTTVIEVGVNVKNASTMIIFNANSFGLSQIHQLRGRVGRNEYSGYCYLVVDDLVSDLERLKILEESNDGFKISEFDLEIRGPGEVFGKQQSGVPNFQFANIISDVKLREAAFSDAKTIIKNADYRAKNLVRSVLQTIKSYNLD